jgi:hypothetical protein
MGQPIFTRRAAAAFVAVAAAGASLGAGAQASVRTTQPEPIRHVKVVLTNTGIQFSLLEVVRGSLVLFKIQNTSTNSRDFFIGGRLVRAVKPGSTRDFQLQFLDRGKFPYYSVGRPGKKFTGSFRVT